jgi:uncharacterized protein
MKKPVKVSAVALVVVLAALAISLVASAKTFLSIATSTSGGTFYAVGGKLADMITKHVPDTQATAEVTAGGVENARQIKNKKTNIAMMPGDTLYNAVNGLAEFSSGKIPIDQIAALYPTPLQILALERSGIKTVADLKGKRVSIGAPGSSTAVRAEIVLKANGLTLNDIRVDKTTSGEASTQLLDRQIDAAFYASGAPMAAIMDVASKEPVRLIPVSPESMAKIHQEHPDLFELVIKAGTYPKVDLPTPCVANMAILVCRPDLNEELVYQVTRMIFEKRDDFITAHKSLAIDFSLQNAMSQPKLAPFHPGALRYYKEKGLVK